MKKIICLITALTLSAGLFGCSAGKTVTDTAPDTSPEATSRAPAGFRAQYIRTDGYNDEVKYPVVTVVNSRAELDSYIEENKDMYYFERRELPDNESTPGFLNACDAYDDAFFENGTLVLVLLEESSGSIRHEVTNTAFSGGEWHISIARDVPEIGTDDMAQWHILIELECAVGKNDIFNVVFS